jgi:hypothetical protein
MGVYVRRNVADVWAQPLMRTEESSDWIYSNDWRLVH